MLLRFLLIMFVGIAYGLRDTLGRRGAGAGPCPPVAPRPGSRLKVRHYLRRSVQFVCEPGHTLLGAAEAACVGGEWSAPAPLCVRAGCKLPASIANGVLTPSVNKAVVDVECEPGYAIVGSGTLYCDGKKWNDTVPTCVKSKAYTNPLSCDFEHGQCGWSSPIAWDLVPATNEHSYHINLGPSSDHTLGPNGHFMMSQRHSNEGLYLTVFSSPIYSPELNNDGCFSFYYFLSPSNRKTLDYLMVSQLIDTVYEERISLNVSVATSGSPGWRRHVVRLVREDHNFQILIHAVTYTPIDDVALLQGEECTRAIADSRVVTTTTTTTTEIPSLSCVNRCPPPDYDYYEDSHEPSAADALCSCLNSCVEHGVCCLDFLSVCAFKNPTARPTAVTASGTVVNGQGHTNNGYIRTTTAIQGSTSAMPTSTHSVLENTSGGTNSRVTLLVSILVIAICAVVACVVFVVKRKRSYSVEGRRHLIKTTRYERTSL